MKINLDYNSITEGLIVALLPAAIIGIFTLIFIKRNSPLTAKKLEKMIELKIKDAIEKLPKTSDDEKPASLKRINELKNHLANLPKYLQDRNELIRTLKTNLEVMLKILLELGGNELLVGKLAIAKADLEKGYLSKTDDFLAELEVAKIINKQTVIKIAFGRGKIAEHEVRWHDAAEHYARAAQLDPCFENLIMAQKLAIDTGDYHSALSLSLDAQKAAIKEYGKNSEQYADCLNNHGTIYQVNRQYEKAKPFHEKALQIRKKTIGKNNPEIAVSLNNLGAIYRSEGQYKEAKKLFKQALDIQNEELAENHPNTANMLNNLAGLYSDNGEYRKAEPLYEQALKIQQALFGEEHPDIAISLNNLAMLYCKEQKYTKAEPLFREAVKILEATLGLNHPDTKLFKSNYELLKKDIAHAEKTTPQ